MKAEELAWNMGFDAGVSGRDRFSNPFKSPIPRDSWEDGYEAGEQKKPRNSKG